MNTLRKRTKFLGTMALAFALLLAAPMVSGDGAQAVVPCTKTVVADVVLIDTPMFFNRLGAHNPNWMTYALLRDVVPIDPSKSITALIDADPPFLGRRNAQFRPDKRLRPLTLRVNAGQCLQVNFTNLLAPQANPLPKLQPPLFNDNQVESRYASFHVAGMQVAVNLEDDGSYVGTNASSLVDTLSGGAGGIPPDGQITYLLYAEHEGAFLITNHGATFGGEATGGNTGVGAFGGVNVEPAGAGHYRSMVTEEELRLATTGHTPLDQPIINYEALYPDDCAGGADAPAPFCQGDNDPPTIGDVPLSGICSDLNTTEPPVTFTLVTDGVWCQEGKAAKPVLNMQCIQAIHGNCDHAIETFHSEVNAIIAGPCLDGSWECEDAQKPYPLERAGLRNPTVPNRLEPFREFSSIWHDENAAVQAFDLFSTPPLKATLHGVRDSFMINYGSGGIGSEIIANRLGVGPMGDCLGCAYEEFFLTSFTVGDPAMLVDIPANVTVGTDLRATKAFFPEDPANVHHSYVGDFAKFRNIHAGPKEQHIFHLHNHQWLFNANDDNSNYLDAQGIGPGSSYTYEINFGGSGNRNKTAGDAIFHCHFYPHFAQGMWYLWRIHDVMETGTLLAVTPNDGLGNATGFHGTAFELRDGTPAVVDADGSRARALPDGEILAGTPIPAVVPLPGKPMPPMPGEVVIVTKNVNPGGDDFPDIPGTQDLPDTSQANVIERNRNPGFPFWIAGVDCGGPGKVNPATGKCDDGIMGQRPPTPNLDMLTHDKAADLVSLPATEAGGGAKEIKTTTGLQTIPLWDGANFAGNAGGFDAGLPRFSIEGVKAALTTGQPLASIVSSSATRLDFHKEVEIAKPVFFPEEGTDLEKVAMATHAIRDHPTCLSDGTCDDAIVDTTDDLDIDFVLNGAPPQPSAPYQEPCIDDAGDVWTGSAGRWFGPDGFYSGGSSTHGAGNPFVYKAANIQIDAVFNKVGYHYSQQRIITLWDDVLPTIDKEKAPEPFVMRLNTYDCAKYLHSNLVPKEFEVDDYQVRTPTDIIGQHIHLPKWDLTTTDGAANGWNYEDGTLAPGTVRERIHSINNYASFLTTEEKTALLDVASDCDAETARSPGEDLEACGHPVLGTGVGNEWKGARVTIQRWFADPVLNVDLDDRGLGIIFTHDHYGPSTHQQIGLYSTLLIEPANSTWRHNETGVELGSNIGRPSEDGGPTSWQAAIEPVDGPPFREFYFEFSDFQHAYEAGMYVGAGPDGRPFDAVTPGAACNQADDPDCHNGGGINTAFPVTNATFRNAINPSFRQQASPTLPDIVRFPPNCGPDGNFEPRPCPEAISADDVGMLVVNYRNEPIGLRVFDPNKFGPDNNRGTQAGGFNAGPDRIAGNEDDVFVNPKAGNLAFALQTRNDRAIPQMNRQPAWGDVAEPAIPIFSTGNTAFDTTFPPPINSGGVANGDPFTPLLRTQAGDTVKVKIQSGATEHEHSASIHAVKWLQGGSGHGASPNSGWRNAQGDGISEQFTFTTTVLPDQGQAGNAADHAYNIDTSQDGWWSGTWGILRSYRSRQGDLYQLEGGLAGNIFISNAEDFAGVCPRTRGRNAAILNLRTYDVTAVLANDVLPPSTLEPTIPSNAGRDSDGDAIGDNEGGVLDPEGGTLVYNPRGGTGATDQAQFEGPLHDPTAIMYVRTTEVVQGANDPDCFDGERFNPVNNAGTAIRADCGINPACFHTDATGDMSFIPKLAGCDLVLADGAPLEPIVLRANAGDCIETTLRNGLLDQALSGDDPVIDIDGNPVFLDEGQDLFVDDNGNGLGDVAYCPAGTTEVFDGTGNLIDCLDGALSVGVSTELVDAADFDKIPDLAGANTLLQMVIRDRNILMQGQPSVTTFNNNLVAPSEYVGLHAQLVEYDVTRDDGVLVGQNPPGEALVAPGGEKLFRWFAGHIKTGEIRRQGRNNVRVELLAMPVELGGINLSPADKIKQGQKGMIGALVIEPYDATWPEDDRDGQIASLESSDPTLENVRDRQQGSATGPGSTRKTRADLTVSASGVDFEDLVVAIQKGQNHRYGDGTFVENIASEGGVIPEDSHDAGQKAINYGTEPAWYRFGLRANADFGNAGGSSLGGKADAWKLYSNDLAGEDPATPVFTAPAAQAVRMRVLMPTGVGRGTTFTLHGNIWQRDPYLAKTVPDQYGNPQLVFSQTIGDNPLGWYLNGQESVTPYQHFDVLLDKAGGEGAVGGDYLFRDQASFGNTDGIWGILRAQ